MLTKIKSFFSRFFSWIWRHKRWVLITLLILWGLGFWWAKKFIKKKPDVSFTSDAEYTVSTGEVVQRLNLAGTTQFANSQKLNFIQEGKITAIFVKVGDNVKKDQVLATISSESLDREMETARNNLKRSREDLEKIQWR